MRPYGKLVAVSCLIGLTGMMARNGYSDHPDSSPCPLNHASESVLAYDVYADGQALHLLGAVRNAQGQFELRYIVSRDGTRTWSAPVSLPMDHGPLHGAHRGNDPQIAASGDRLIAVWSTSGEGFMGSGPMRSALSSDGGRTWKAGPAPAVQDRPLSQGFCDLVMHASGRADLVWLGSHRELRGLHHAHSMDAGISWNPSEIVDSQTCECCWNRLAGGSNGELVTLYRDRDPRDLRVAAQSKTRPGWAILSPPVSFNWQIEACPHAGGGLAVETTAASLQIHTTVWTAGERGGLYYARSSNAGQTWSESHRLAAATASHSDLAVLPNRRILIVWSDAHQDHSAIFGVWSGDGGATWSEVRMLSSENIQAEAPRTLSLSGAAVVVWSQKRSDENAGIQTLVLNAP